MSKESVNDFVNSVCNVFVETASATILDSGSSFATKQFLVNIANEAIVDVFKKGNFIFLTKLWYLSCCMDVRYWNIFIMKKLNDFTSDFVNYL